MTCSAYVLTKFRAPLELRTFQLPVPGPGEILVRLAASGVCGSDLHMYLGEDPRTPLPIILGHEGVGWVEAMGSSQDTVDGRPVKEGDLITWNRGVACNRCYACKVLRQPSYCTGRQIYGINLSCDQLPHLNGCYSEYILLRPGTDLYLLPSSIDPAAVCSACCSGATVAHAFDLANIHPGDTVVVQGPGPLGVWASYFARRRGAGQVAVIGGSENRLKMCQQFGATHLLNRRILSLEQRQEAVLQLTGGRGADCVVECAGTNGAAVEGIRLLRQGGVYLSTGYAQPAGLEQLDFFTDVVRRGVTIHGVWVSDACHVYHAVTTALENPELFASMVSHRLPLREANHALALMQNRKAIKIALVSQI